MSDLFEMLDEVAESKLEALKVALSLELSEANFRIVKARVRGGKIQRKRKVSTRPGYTFRGGKMVRMSSAERMKRKRGARKGKTKRKAKLARSMMKRKRSLRKRRSLGV
jgi:hypothetical protein